MRRRWVLCYFSNIYPHFSVAIRPRDDEERVLGGATKVERPDLDADGGAVAFNQRNATQRKRWRKEAEVMPYDSKK